MGQRQESSTGLAWALSRARVVLRVEGVASLLLRFLAALGYRTGIWCVAYFQRPFDAPFEDVEPSVPLEYGELGPKDGDEYARVQSRTTLDQFQRRHEAGNVCYTARCDGRLVASVWAAGERVFLDYLGETFDLEPGEAMFFDAHTDPEYRGRRVMPWLRTEAMRDLQARGYRAATGMAALENRSSFATLRRVGFYRSGTMVYVRIGRLRWRHFWGRRSQAR